MSNTHYLQRWIVAGLLASTAVSLASPALARDRRYKGAQQTTQRVVVRERSNSAAPLVAGLIGGFLLGAAVTSSAQSHPVAVHDDYYDDDRYYSRPVAQPVYRYYDPYGDDWYDSLDECRFVSGGPRVVFVIDIGSGQRVRSLQYRQGRWNRYDGDVVVYRGGSRQRFANSGYRYKKHRDSRDDDDRRYRRNDDDDDRRRRHRSHDRDDD